MHFRALTTVTLLSSLALAHPQPPPASATPAERYKVCSAAIVDIMTNSGQDQNQAVTTYKERNVGDCTHCELWAASQALPAESKGEEPEEVQRIYNTAKAKCDHHGVPDKIVVTTVVDGVIKFVFEIGGTWA